MTMGGGNTLGTAVLELTTDNSKLTGGLGDARKSAGKAFTAIGAAGVAAFSLAAKSAADFQTGMFEVNTLVNLGKDQLDTLSKGALDLAERMGIDAIEATKALYQAISAGQAPETVMEFMQVAAEGAVAGVTTLETAVDGLTSIMNAWGLSADRASSVSDVMFAAVKGGKTTFEELSASIFQAAPIAASLGISFEEVAASAATLTKQGIPTKIAMTSLRQAMVSLQKPTAEMEVLLKQIGFESGTAAIEALGLQGTLQKLRTETGASKTEFAKAVGSVEALLAVLGITGDQAAEFAIQLKAAENASGNTSKAFDIMRESASFAFGQLKSSLQVIIIEVGTVLLPILKSALDAIRPIISSIRDWAKANPGLAKVLVVVAAGISALLLVLGPLLLIIPLLSMATAAFGITLSAAIWPVTGIAAAIAALTAGIILLWQNWKLIRDFLTGATDRFKWLRIVLAAVGGPIVALGLYWRQVSNAILTATETMVNGVIAGLNFIIRGINKLGSVFGLRIGEIADVHLPRLKRVAKDTADSVVESEEDIAAKTAVVEGRVAQATSGMVRSFTKFAETAKQVALDTIVSLESITAAVKESARLNAQYTVDGVNTVKASLKDELDFTQTTAQAKIDAITEANEIILKRQREFRAEQIAIQEGAAKKASDIEVAAILQSTVSQDEFNAYLSRKLQERVEAANQGNRDRLAAAQEAAAEERRLLKEVADAEIETIQQRVITNEQFANYRARRAQEVAAAEIAAFQKTQAIVAAGRAVPVSAGGTVGEIFKWQEKIKAAQAQVSETVAMGAGASIEQVIYGRQLTDEIESMQRRVEGLRSLLRRTENREVAFRALAGGEGPMRTAAGGVVTASQVGILTAEEFAAGPPGILGVPPINVVVELDGREVGEARAEAATAEGVLP